MFIAVEMGRRAEFQPLTPQEQRARRAQRRRALILILVASVVATLALHGVSVADAVFAVGAVVLAAWIVARYLSGPTRARAYPAAETARALLLTRVLTWSRRAGTAPERAA